MLLQKHSKTPPLLLLLSAVMLVAILTIGYLIPHRSNIYSYWLAMGCAFFSYFIITHKFNDEKSIRHNVLLIIALRASLLFSLPILSDDFYRFIWDGAQILHGVNPFKFTPKELITFDYSWINPELFAKMNSPEYFSVYPPINQLAFAAMALAGKGNLLSSVVIFRCIIILFDLGNCYLLKKLLQHFKKPQGLVLLYALNPLVIIELTGNLHFEVAMIFFTLLSAWFLVQKRWVVASIALGFAVCAKLLPLIFLPLFVKHIGFKKTLYASLIVGVTVLVLFLPFIYNLSLAQHLFSSLQLYYGKFEFNGSIYKLLKEIGWGFLGYNPIFYTSKILLVLTLTGFAIAYRKSKTMLEGIFWLIVVYNLFGAVVHPWYIIILVAFTPFLNWRFAILWSLLICLSYFTYVSIPYQESAFLTFVEYGLLFFAIGVELKAKRLKKLV